MVELYYLYTEVYTDPALPICLTESLGAMSWCVWIASADKVTPVFRDSISKLSLLWCIVATNKFSSVEDIRQFGSVTCKDKGRVYANNNIYHKSQTALVNGTLNNM